MRRTRQTFGGVTLALFLGTSALSAQTLNEVCPDSEDGTGALWGLVSDEDAEMGLPGATVSATWQKDGDDGRAEGQTALDGSYTICYVPLGVDLAVQPIFANLGGTIVTTSLTEPITRVDLGFSLSGGGDPTADGDDRIWGCVSGDDNQINLQNSRIIRCEPGWQVLERCPKTEEFGRVQTNLTGVAERGLPSPAMIREGLEKLTDDAKRLGANALINWELRGGSFAAEAVRIEVDPSTCT